MCATITDYLFIIPSSRSFPVRTSETGNNQYVGTVLGICSDVYWSYFFWTI